MIHATPTLRRHAVAPLLGDQNDPAKALANTRALIEDKRVFAMAGYTFTNIVMVSDRERITD